MAADITDANFKTEVLDFQGVALVDFWATWCGPCRIQGPIVESLGEKFKDESNFKVTKLDVDENPATAQTYQVLSIPTLMIFKKGQVVEVLVGLRSEQDLDTKIRYYLNS
jgi:thioredoxin 1